MCRDGGPHPTRNVTCHSRPVRRSLLRLMRPLGGMIAIPGSCRGRRGTATFKIHDDHKARVRSEADFLSVVLPRVFLG